MAGQLAPPTVISTVGPIENESVVGKPSKIGKYDVIDVLGRGGMGVVYKATDPHLNRLVAIKMMTGGFSDNPDLLKRFYREAQSTGNLQHPNIVTVYDLGDLDGTPYLVMEYLEGETLDAIINARSSLTMLAKINFICEVCQGLAYAHHHGIVHRDIKPGNVMVLKNGSIKIVDFGIAHIGDKTVTRTGQLIGSLGYMSPEQVNGRPIDTRTDIFSTGVVLYQLLTYTLPFDGDSTAATLLKIIHDPPPPLDKFITDAPPDLEGVILRALAKDREQRYRTVEDLGFDLAQIRDRLKEGLVEGHLREAESLLSRGFTLKAKELLLQVLKIDRQHTGAIRLFRSVQQSIEQEQIGAQIKQFRSQAEEACANHQFDAALNYVENALNLHQTDADLQSLKASIRQAKLQAEELQNLLHRAEVARREGDLDVAKKVLEETLELAPNDLEAKALFRVIKSEWEERSRREQVGNLVDSARKEIASRRFTAALDILKEAEALDPNAPEVKSLIESAKAGKEQERFRQELESINHQIEEALDHDDFVTAGQTIDQGLLKFPEDRTLLKLKALAEKQRQVNERKQFINEQLAEARALIQAGQNQEVLKLLDAALQRVGSDPHLQSLQGIVRETVERERVEQRKRDLLQRAKECLRRKEFSEAIEILEGASAQFHKDGDVVDLLQFAKEEAIVDLKKKATEAVVERARVLIENDEYDQAVQVLEAGLPDEYEQEVGIALAQARNAAAEYQKRLEAALAAAARLLQNHKAQDAAKLLESQPVSFRRDPVYTDLLKQAHRDAERWQSIENAIAQARQLAVQGSFDEALRFLEESNRSLGEASELREAAAEIQERRSADATEKLESVMSDGRMLMMAKEYRAVVDRLKTARELAGVASSKLRQEFETLQSQAAAALVRQRKSQIEQLLRKGEHLEAAELLRGSQTEFPDSRSLSDLKKKLDDAVRSRGEVQNLLNTARRLFSEQAWKEGGEACARAISLATVEPWLREQAIEVALRAAETALEVDWTSAETLADKLTQVRAGSAIPESLHARIAAKKREQAVEDAVIEARRLQTSGDLQAALDFVEKQIASFPSEASLKGLQSEFRQLQGEQEERARIENERLRRLEHLRTVTEQLEREPAIEARVRILEDALRAFPDEPSLQSQLAHVRELTRSVADCVSKAKAFEEAREYPQAIQTWEEIKSLDPHFPLTATSLERLRGVRQQELVARKATLVGRLEVAFATYDLDQAAQLLTQAKAEFSTDPQILGLEKALDERASNRARALKLIAEGQTFFEKRKWEKGRESLQSAVESAQGDLSVRQQAISAAIQAAESALVVDWQSAGKLADLIAQLDSSSAEPTKIRTVVDRRKREAIVTQHLLSAQKLESDGNFNGALSELAPGLLAYPDEPQLVQRKQALEERVRAADEASQKEKRIAEHEGSAQKLYSAGDLKAALDRVRQGLSEFPNEARLLRMKGVVEKSIGEAEEANRREQERKREEEERQRLKEAATAARAEENRKREEAEKLRLEQARQRQEEVRREEAERQRLQEAATAARAEEKLKREEAEKLRLEQARQRQEEARRKEEEERQRLQEAEKVARAEEKRKREDDKKLRLEQARQRQEDARRRAEDKKLRERERLAKKRQAAATSVEPPVAGESREIRLASIEGLAKLRGAKAWLSAAAALVFIIVIAVATQSFLVRRGTLVIRNAVPGTSIRVEEGTYTVRDDGSVSIPLKPGPHVVELAKDGYQNKELRIDIARGKELPVTDAALSPLPVSSHNLIPTPGRPNGTLIIETGNKDVSVYVDNVKQNGGGRGRLRISVPPVEHEIRAENPGYVTRSVRTQVSSNIEKQVDLRLERETVAPQRASLQIRSAVPGSQVFVDGQNKGTVAGNGSFSSDVSEGDHEISLVTNAQKSNAIKQRFAKGSQVALDGSEFKPIPPPVNTEDTAWLQVRDSHSISALESFLGRFPNTPHRGEAEPKLDDLYWSKATDAKTAADFRDYQSRYPNGRHSQDAQSEIAKLDWQQAQNTSDPRVLEDFLKRYPIGSSHDQAAAKLDDLIWQRDGKANDAASLRDYLTRFPTGRHAVDARAGLDQLAAPTPPARVETVDDKTVIMAVLERYKRAYENQSVSELQAIWPGMGPQQISHVGVFFKSARSVTLAYNLLGEPQLSGTSSTVTFTQSLSFVINGKQQKTSAQVTMQLKKAGSGTWLIESIR